MSDFEKEKKDLQSLKAAIDGIKSKAAAEGRALNGVEKSLVNEMQKNADQLQAPANAPLTFGSGTPGGDATSRKDGGLRIFGGREKKSFANMFHGHPKVEWTDKNATFYSAFFSGRFHPEFRNDLSETLPSTGGSLIPTQYVSDIFDLMLETSIILPRCTVIPATTREIHLPATAIGSHETSLYGGYKGYWIDEADTITSSDPEFREILLTLKKLAGLIVFSNELRLDSPNGVKQINRILADGSAFEIDSALISGTGAGQPLGMLSGDDCIEVEKESGQAASTVMWENICNMLSRLHPSCYKDAIWLAHPSLIPSLLTMSVSVGTGGDRVRVLNEDNGEFTMLTKKVVFTEKVASLGESGDLALVSPSHYVVALGSDMRLDLDPYSKFTTDQTQARVVNRIDGCSMLNESLTLKDGTHTQGAFVKLGERS